MQSSRMWRAQKKAAPGSTRPSPSHNCLAGRFVSDTNRTIFSRLDKPAVRRLAEAELRSNAMDWNASRALRKVINAAAFALVTEYELGDGVGTLKEVVGFICWLLVWSQCLVHGVSPWLL